MEGSRLDESRGNARLSSIERGEGRSDIILKPRDDALPVTIIEMKQGNASSRELEVISKEALQQIKSKKIGFGYPALLAYGMAFRDKEVSILSERIGYKRYLYMS